MSEMITCEYDKLIDKINNAKKEGAGWTILHRIVLHCTKCRHFDHYTSSSSAAGATDKARVDGWLIIDDGRCFRENCKGGEQWVAQR